MTGHSIGPSVGPNGGSSSDHSIGQSLAYESAIYRDAVEECARIIAEHSKSFAFASRLLPKNLRGEVAVLYAWCRRADDAVDEAPPSEAPSALATLIRELEAVYAQEESDLVKSDLTLSALRVVVRRRRIPKYYPEQLLEGMRMDLEGIDYNDRESLYLYCYRVASTVGLMMCHLMGIRRESALSQAARLGLAMQITNICRDVSEDWGRQRLYLPHVMLQRFISERDVSTLIASQVLPSNQLGVRFKQHVLPEPLRRASQAVIATLLDEADEHYQAGYRGVDALPWRAAFAIQAAGMIYQDIGRVLRSHECDPHQPRAFTSTARKSVLACIAVVSTLIKLSLASLKRLFSSRHTSAMSPPHDSLHTPRMTLTFEMLRDHLHCRSLQHRVETQHEGEAQHRGEIVQSSTFERVASSPSDS